MKTPDYTKRAQAIRYRTGKMLLISNRMHELIFSIKSQHGFSNSVEACDYIADQYNHLCDLADAIDGRQVFNKGNRLTPPDE